MSAKPDWHVPLAAFEAGLAQAAEPFFVGLWHGSMRVELFAPVGADTQQPHVQDELYIVRAGRSGFVKGEERREVAAGDVIFVEAGAPHRFVDFSADFSTWVIFWGREGGEGQDVG